MLVLVLVLVLVLMLMLVLVLVLVLVLLRKRVVGNSFEVEVSQPRQVVEDIPAVAGAKAVLPGDRVPVEAQLQEGPGFSTAACTQKGSGLWDGRCFFSGAS